MTGTSGAGTLDERLTEAVRASRQVVWLDDDPTGTQAVRDLPVLTSWRPDDVAWAIAQGGPGFFVLTNTRSLDPDDAAARVREVVRCCLRVAREAGTTLVFASRGDSTLRSHFPVETDAIAAVLAQHGLAPSALVLAPAFPRAGRVTVGGVHYVRGPAGLEPAAETEYARDATFGYRSSDLADWAREKAQRPLDVVRIPRRSDRPDDRALLDLFAPMPPADPTSVERVIVIDAEDDDDLRSAAIPLLAAERAGTRFVYQVGPAFVGARSAQLQAPLVDDERLDRLVDRGAHGLVVVGSHVDRTTRQLAALTDARDVTRVELDARLVLEAPVEQVAEVAGRVTRALAHGPTVLTTSRGLVRGEDGAASLSIARRVSNALSQVVRQAVRQQRPGYLVAKGGITSSQVATDALDIHRAWVVGTMLPGLVSLWRVADGPVAGLAYVVFPGNVGEDDALLRVVDRLERTP